jgi:hypothetical protein
VSILALSDNCFTGDTLVATEDGQKRIDEIKVGDKVWAYDIFTGETALKEVTTFYVHEVDEILHLHTSCGDIDTTTNHPFYVLEKGWVAAGDLYEGDEVHLIDGTTAIVTGAEIEKLEDKILVYNLEVADFDTFFVGEKAVLVHNYPATEPGGGNTSSTSASQSDGGFASQMSEEDAKRYIKFFTKDAPMESIPGDVKFGTHVNGKGREEPWIAFYDELGRLLGRTDYNAGNKTDGTPDTHYHLYEFINGSVMPIAKHVAGEFRPWYFGP